MGQEMRAILLLLWPHLPWTAAQSEEQVMRALQRKTGGCGSERQGLPRVGGGTPGRPESRCPEFFEILQMWLWSGLSCLESRFRSVSAPWLCAERWDRAWHPLGAGRRPECGGRSQAQTSMEAIGRASAQPLGRRAWHGDLGVGRAPPGTPEPAHTRWDVPASEGLLRSLLHLRD